MVPNFWIVLFVSLIAFKRIELITRDWSEFEDILEENMIDFQNKGKGAPRGPHGGPKGPPQKIAKNDQNLEFFGFCHHPSHSGKKICYCYTNMMRKEQ